MKTIKADVKSVYLKARIEKEFSEDVKLEDNLKSGNGIIPVAILLAMLSGATTMMPWMAPVVWIVAGVFVWLSPT